MAQAAWMSALPERRSDLALHDTRDAPSTSPRLPPLSEIARYGLPGQYNSAVPREKRMQVDYPGLSTGQHTLYGQQDAGDPQGYNQDVNARGHFQDSPTAHGFVGEDHVPHHSSYDMYSTNSSDPLGSFTSQRYRSNTSSSSSLAGGYGMGSDSLYPHPSFSEHMSSLAPAANHGGYEMPGLVPYGSGKRSPLTPSDTPTFPAFQGPDGIKDFSHIYPDQTLDRRSSNVSIGSSYQSDFHEDYGVPVHPTMNVGYGLPLPMHDRAVQYQSNSRVAQAPGQPSPLHTQMNADPMQGVSPHATSMFRSPGGGNGYEHYLPSPGTDLSISQPSMDENLARLKIHSGPTTDLASFMRPFLDQYVRTPNRLAFGERTIIVMSSKVAQKSYGTEKRFLCPPPTAVLVGNSWWSEVHRMGEDSRLSPPRVVVSISGEAPPPENSVDWSGSAGKPFDVNDPPTGTTYIGRCVGKQLYISDVDDKRLDDKRKKVEAHVKVFAPSSSDNDEERVIGTFVSRPIKVISKPSKKRQSAKNLELCINHGSTVSLFHRLRSQTVSTKYLCVSGSGSSFKGSDGAPLMGLDARTRTASPSFIAKTSSWDPFVLYIVDVNKPPGVPDSLPLSPPQGDYPSPPPNAIPFTNNGSPIPVYYNQTVVLQCLTSGVVSPILIMRKVDHQTTVVGGGAQEGSKSVNDSCCVPGETWGDPVSQLAKVAFEVYDARKSMPEPGTPGLSGAFLSCMGEKVNTYRPVDGRQWTPRYTDSPLQSPVMSQSPVSIATSASYSSMGDYFGPTGIPSMPGSPDLEYPTNDGGRVRKGKRSTSSAGGIVKATGSKSSRRRPNSAGSMGGRPGDAHNPSSGAQWQVDIGETSVWTIVGVDQVRYNFYIPPTLFDHQNAPQSRSFPIPSTPVTPFPGVVKYLPPDRAAEVPKHHYRSLKPQADTSKMLTLYGENFNKAEPVSVFFGSDPSPYVEVRCTEVIGCLPPEQPSNARRPIILVRGDGVVFPSNTMYP